MKIELNFYETIKDDGEIFQREVPACHCSECGKGIYQDDDCFSFPVPSDKPPFIVCEDCIYLYKEKGRDGAVEFLKHRNNKNRRYTYETVRNR